MKRRLLAGACCFVLIFCFGLSAQAQMASENYRIPSSVFSGGGASMDSGAGGSYWMDGTVGQPSPLMDPDDPPVSMDYLLFPGFWYTLEPGIALCEDLPSFASAFGSLGFSFCDPDEDGDVDGYDLAGFAGSL